MFDYQRVLGIIYHMISHTYPIIIPWLLVKCWILLIFFVKKRSPYLILFGRSNSSSIFWPERLLANMKMEEHQVPPDTSGLLEGMDTIDAPKWIYNSNNWDSWCIYIYQYNAVTNQHIPWQHCIDPRIWISPGLRSTRSKDRDRPSWGLFVRFQHLTWVFGALRDLGPDHQFQHLCESFWEPNLSPSFWIKSGRNSTWNIHQPIPIFGGFPVVMLQSPQCWITAFLRVKSYILLPPPGFAVGFSRKHRSLIGPHRPGPSCATELPSWWRPASESAGAHAGHGRRPCCRRRRGSHLHWPPNRDVLKHLLLRNGRWKKRKMTIVDVIQSNIYYINFL